MLLTCLKPLESVMRNLMATSIILLRRSITHANTGLVVMKVINWFNIRTLPSLERPEENQA
eukprot:4392409-Ditylum_brightwellii.AAC.1